MENQTPYGQAPPPATVPPGTPADLVPFIQQQANILAADVTFARPSPMHKIVVERVQLDPDPKGPDVYYHSQMKGLVISGAGLAKIANTAGIIWDVARCHRTDNRSNPNYCSFQAVGGVKKPDGSIIWCRAEADMDLDVERQAAIKSFSRNKSGDALKVAVDNYILQKRQFMLRICESNARNRVIRKLLPIKPTYTPEELKRPFVTVRTVFEPDYQNDPIAKQIMMQVYAQAQFGIFGERVSNVIDVPPALEEAFDVEGAPEPSPAVPSSGQSVSEPPKVAEIEDLAARKGYDLLTLPKPLEQYSERALETFKAKLEALPDKARQPGEEMIPF